MVAFAAARIGLRRHLEVSGSGEYRTALDAVVAGEHVVDAGAHRSTVDHDGARVGVARELEAGQGLRELRLALGDVGLVADEDGVAVVGEGALGDDEGVAGDVELGGGVVLGRAVGGAGVGGAGVDELARGRVGAGEEEGAGGGDEEGRSTKIHGVTSVRAVSTRWSAEAAALRACSSRVRTIASSASLLARRAM